MRGLIFIVLLGLILPACKKAEDRKCFKSAGEEVTTEVSLPSFNQLFLGPHINFTLVQDTTEYMRIKAGENLIKHVTSELIDGVLEIRNTNKCNFLRSYKKQIDVELHIKNLTRIQYEGTKPLYCSNTLQQPELRLVIRDGAGKVNLNFQGARLHTVVTNGWGNFDLNGSVDYLKLEIGGSGFGSTYDMQVNDSLHVISNSSENVKVNADGILFRCETNSRGNIWYKGYPTFLDFNRYGDGDLLDKN
jgi:hypothetical protein